MKSSEDRQVPRTYPLYQVNCILIRWKYVTRILSTLYSRKYESDPKLFTFTYKLLTLLGLQSTILYKIERSFSTVIINEFQEKIHVFEVR